MGFSTHFSGFVKSICQLVGVEVSIVTHCPFADLLVYLAAFTVRPILADAALPHLFVIVVRIVVIPGYRYAREPACLRTSHSTCGCRQP